MKVQAIKYPCISGVLASSLFPSSCGQLRRNWHPSCGFARGLPGFTGPFPSTSLDEQISLRLFNCSVLSYSKYTGEDLILSRSRSYRILAQIRGRRIVGARVVGCGGGRKKKGELLNALLFLFVRPIGRGRISGGEPRR